MPEVRPEQLEDQRLTRAFAIGYFLLAVDILDGIAESGETPHTDVTISGDGFVPNATRFYGVQQASRRNLVMYQETLGNYHEYLPHLKKYVTTKDPDGKDRPDQECPVYKYLARAYHYLETRERIRPSGPGKLMEYRAEKHRHIERGLRLFYKNDADFRFAWEALTGMP